MKLQNLKYQSAQKCSAMLNIVLQYQYYFERSKKDLMNTVSIYSQCTKVLERLVDQGAAKL